MTIMPAHGDLISNVQASGAVQPGEVVERVAAAGAESYQAVGTPQGRVAKVAGTPASATRGLRRLGVAMRPIEHSSLFTDPNSTNTNIAQSNTEMADGDWVRVAYSGVILTTLTEQTASASVASTFAPGTLLTWDGAATRPTGISGTGAWAPCAANETPLAEVVSIKPVGDGGLLELKLLA
jgi:hypothetical protein